ncbi:MAG: hypothetical protein ACR2P4_01850 [Gammaproteobacteria bacterium]
MTKNIPALLRPFLVVLFLFGFGSLIGFGVCGPPSSSFSPPPFL